jgi:hypothetical protein
VELANVNFKKSATDQQAARNPAPLRSFGNSLPVYDIIDAGANLKSGFFAISVLSGRFSSKFSSESLQITACADDFYDGVISLDWRDATECVIHGKCVVQLRYGDLLARITYGRTLGPYHDQPTDTPYELDQRRRRR